MKKSLVALAVAAALPAFAQAQTNVQLLGSIDVGVESVNGDANGGISDIRVQNGLWAGSRFGIVGSEDLGGGMRALFNIEHRLNVDTGTVTAGATFWNGQTWIGLGGGFGTVRLGRNYSPIFRALAPGDATGYSWYNNSVGLAGTQIRLQNAVHYESPRLGGFTIHGAYAAGESATDNKAGDALGIAGVGAIGPISVGLGYHAIDLGGGLDRTELGLGLGARLGGFGLGLGYAVTEVDTAAASNKTTGVFFSASAKLGTGTAYLAVKRIDPEGDNNNDTGFALSYSHGLSKRTFMYASVGINKVQRAVGDDLSQRRIGVGVRHFF